MSEHEESGFVLLSTSDAAGYNDAGHLPLSDQEVAEISTWLKPTKYHSEHSEYRKHINSYLDGTGQWFWNSKAYRKFHDDPAVGALWVKAVAGAGKSVLAAATAAKLAREEDVPVLFFFFRQIVELNHDPKYLVRDWLAQLLPHSPWLQHGLKKFLQDRKIIGDVPSEDLWRLTCDALSFLPKAYCIADALDEMDNDQNNFIQKLIELGQRKPEAIKLLLTSRPIPRIEDMLRLSTSQVRLDLGMIEGDVDLYVEHKLKPIGGPPTFYDTLKPVICSRAKGLFLYARLVTDELIDAVRGTNIDPADIPKIVECIPEDLEGVYNRMLVENSMRSGISQEQQLTLLSWVTHTVRPLRLIEAATVMQMVGGAGSTLKDTKALVRAACGPLLEILEDETLSVIHHSFTEYLTRPDRSRMGFPTLDAGDAHRSIALTCVKYMSNGCLDNYKLPKVPFHNDADWSYSSITMLAQNLILKYPLLEYALSSWHKHLSLASFDHAFTATIDEFFQPDRHSLRVWLDLCVGAGFTQHFTAMHIAAWAGATRLIGHLLQKGESADAKDRWNRTPIYHAAANGHTEAVTALLAAKVTIFFPDSADKDLPIYHAARGNHHKVVRLLLEAAFTPRTGSESRQQSSRSVEIVAYLCSDFGHIESMLELIPYLDRAGLHKALHSAASKGRTSVVKALLQSPAIDVDHRSHARDIGRLGTPLTALFRAAVNGDSSTMRTLLQRGASKEDLEIFLAPSYSPLEGSDTKKTIALIHAFAGKVESTYLKRTEDALKASLEVLLDIGCDINAGDSAGKTALYYACQRGRDDGDGHLLVKLLLDNGADATVLTHEGESVLHLCNRNQSAAVTNLLIEAGANINQVVASGRHAGTAVIHEIAGNFSEDVVLDFLYRKPVVTVARKNGDTALHLVTKGNRRTFYHAVEKLIELGADASARNKKGETPMHLCPIDCLDAKGFVQLLLKAGADINARDNQGQTLLSKALQVWGDRDKRSIDWLVELGADVRVKDFQGRSLMHYALSGRTGTEKQLLQLLLRWGVDPLITDYAGNTLFHAIVQREHDSTDISGLLETIRELGVPVAARNHEGRTALHIAAGIDRPRNHDRILTYFLDPTHDIDVNAADNAGVCALHIAASLSEHIVVSLMKAGADPYTLTFEDQSALHIAAKGRQSNIVGFLIQAYKTDGRVNFVNVANRDGRTALHEACRAGRPEMVRTLLEAGADVHARDKKGRTPLHACAETMEERSFWRFPGRTATRTGLDAANFLLGDTWRPHTGRHLQSKRRRADGDYSSQDQDNELIRVGEVVRVLLEYGADLDAISKREKSSPFELAVTKACHPMIYELLQMTQIGKREEVFTSKVQESLDQQIVNNVADTVELDVEDVLAQKKDHRKQINQLHHDLNTTEPANTFEMLKGNLTKYDLPAADLIQELSIFGYDRIVSDLVRCGSDFALLKECSPTASSIHWVASNGYHEILRSVDAGICRKFEDESWVRAFDKQKVGRWEAVRRYTPVLHAACSRTLPNLPTVKVLVDDLGVDVNTVIRAPKNSDREPYFGFQGGLSPLHVLVKGEHWWHQEAVEFLLERNADIEAKDNTGRTPLLTALNSPGSLETYRFSIVSALLEHGADVKATDEIGLSCLNYAISDSKMIRLLVKYGADVNHGAVPPLLSAMKCNNIDSVSILIDLGADVNRPLLDSKQVFPGPASPPSRFPSQLFTETYPIFYAAHLRVSGSLEAEKRVSIVKLLLEKGANPYVNVTIDESSNSLSDEERSCTLIHTLITDSNVLEPFLAQPDLQLEYRDPQGRTLLHAACLRVSGDGGDRLNKLSKKDIIELLISRGAHVRATDHEGLSVLHHLCRTETRPERLTEMLTNYPDLIHMHLKKGATALHYALKYSKIPVIRALIDAGGDIAEPCPEGKTALHYFSRRNHIFENDLMRDPDLRDLFQEAIDAGVSINARNSVGESALHTFISSMSTMLTFQETVSAYMTLFCDVLDFFADRGADFFAVDNDGKGLLHAVAKKLCNFGDKRKVACLKGVFMELVRRGLDPRMEDKGNLTSLDVAAVCQNEVVLRLFRRNGDGGVGVDK